MSGLTEELPTEYCSEPSITGLTHQVWASKTVPKIKHFMWQALTNYVPVCSRLADRHCHPDRRCPRCGQHEETINHMLFECHMATQTWSLAALPTDPGELPSSSMYGNFDFLLNRIHKRHSTEECKAWILWFLWKAQNEKVFSNKDISPLEVLQSAVSETTCWCVAQIGPDALEVNESSMIPEPQYIPPQRPFCRIDASWKEDDDTN